MTGSSDSNGLRRGKRWRIVLWGAAALVLLLPLPVMQFTGQMAWDAADFAIFGGMLIGACSTYEVSARVSGSPACRAAIGLALAVAFVLVWLKLAVGIIGSEDNPANLMYGGVLAVGVGGAVTARFRPRGMARALIATALAQVLVGVIAVIAGWGSAWILTGIFVALWLTSAMLFQLAAREGRSMDAAT